MSNELMMNLEDYLVSFIKNDIMVMYIIFLILVIKDQKSLLNKKNISIIMISSLIISFIFVVIRNKISFFLGIIILILLISVLMLKLINGDIMKNIIVTIISVSINNIVFFMASALAYIFCFYITKDEENLRMIISVTIYIPLITCFLRTKKFKKGFSFLNNKISDEYFGTTIFMVSIIILFIIVCLITYTNMPAKKVGIWLIIFAILIFITIYKSFDLYYKQKQLIATLEKTKEELENKTKEVERLEEENLNFSKTSHSLAHKQRILEHKINQLMQSGSSADKSKVKEEFDKISNELYKSPEDVELTKTGIDEIDSVLEYMQSECTKNKIDFQLQISGNIYYMVNNIISREKLEILLADHIKNAIIAIQYSDNVNKSILVRIGNIEDVYSVYIYDSGIEFEKETLENLGKKPSTTHADNGGTGMGFMNTFDTLKEYKASLIINEFNAPTKDNFTKSIVIKFDGKENFEIKTYKTDKTGVKIDVGAEQE